MVIDAHAHYDPRILDIGTTIAKMDAAGIDKVALIPTMNDPLPHTPDILLAVFRRLMDSRRLHPCAHWMSRSFMTKDDDVRLRGQVYRVYHRPDNHSVAEILRLHGQRFMGWIFLNPRGSDNPADALDELEQWRQIP